jgi:DNA-3-methyladenine glycosylase II
MAKKELKPRKPASRAATKRAAPRKAVKKAPKKRAKKVARKKAQKRRRAVAAPAGPRYHPGPPIDSEAALEIALAALRAQDEAVIAAMMEVAGPTPLRKRDAGLAGLIWIIVSQQVSTASANAIHARFLERFPIPEAAAILAADDETLRACGLSAPKMRTLRAISEAIVSGALDIAGLAALEADAAHAALIAVKGIGPWTADIFLLFSLGHPDAWPVGDLALQEAARMALKLRKRPDAAQLEKLGERWRPWRGAAARLLWAYYAGMKRLAKNAAP